MSHYYSQARKSRYSLAITIVSGPGSNLIYNPCKLHGASFRIKNGGIDDIWNNSMLVPRLFIAQLYVNWNIH